jgi:hypothetical protein
VPLIATSTEFPAEAVACAIPTTPEIVVVAASAAREALDTVVSA